MEIPGSVAAPLLATVIDSKALGRHISCRSRPFRASLDLPDAAAGLPLHDVSGPLGLPPRGQRLRLGLRPLALGALLLGMP